jgi:hypothetical protein
MIMSAAIVALFVGGTLVTLGVRRLERRIEALERLLSLWRGP